MFKDDILKVFYMKIKYDNGIGFFKYPSHPTPNWTSLELK